MSRPWADSRAGAWIRSKRAGPLVVAVLLGLIMMFGAGWVLAGGRARDDAASGAGPRVSTGTSRAEDGGPPTGAGSPSAGASGGPTDSRAAGDSASSAGLGALPSLSEASRAPIGPFDCPTSTVRVSNAAQLTAALAAARPGAVITMTAGVYSGEFVTTRSGTAKKPIYLCGERAAVLDAGAIKGGYGLHLDGASHWRVKGFTVRDSQKGVVLDSATGVGLEGLLVEQIGDEAVHLRRGSTRNVVRGLTIRRTGLRKPKFGEGVYVGTAKHNWCEVNKCRADQSDGNFVLENAFSSTSAEAIDIKEGTSGGVVSGNRFDGAGITGADSWVDVKGNGWLISDNHGSRAPVDGYQVHEIVDGWGYRNLFSANVSAVDAGGYAIKVTKTRSANVVKCNNLASAAGEGLTNIACS
jgi:hypothetical protein